MEKDYVEDLGAGGRIILTLILKNYMSRACTEFIGSG